jgi:hypothetical protein
MMGDFHGLATRIIGNQYLRLEFLAEAGPRIVRLFVAESDENQLAEMPDIKWETPYGEYFVRGGHRLWHAPEAYPRSYIPDNNGLMVQETAAGVRLCQPAEADTGIRKSIEVRLHADKPALTLVHELRNDGLWPVELAPWAITQLRLGGVAVLPQQVESLDKDGLLPNRHLVLWPYTHWRDPRLQVGDEYLLIQAQVQSAPCKVGCFNRRGWMGYLRQGVFFCKRFEPQTDRPHPDLGCNVEVYCNHRFVEMETLAPLCHLESGQSTIHVETWEFYTGLDVPQTLEGVQALVRTINL